MKRIIVVVFISLLSLSIIGCSGQDIPSYEGHEGVPDFGVFCKDAEYDEEYTQMTKESFYESGENYPDISVYNIPTDKVDVVEEYTTLLESMGFTQSSGTSLYSGKGYLNQDKTEGVLVACNEDVYDSSISKVTIILN
ncbi:hypothetical protein [Emergencia sp.]|uniref:hypothetical protein n=1 Tax=Emergencia sp. TaxID=1926557 RepID=UPI003AF1D505